MTEPITMYQIESWSQKIKPIEVVKLTAKSAFISNGSCGTTRLQLKSKYYEIHPTWEEAHAALLARAERSLTRARLQLQAAQGEHGIIVGMKNPCYTEQTPTAPNQNEH
jgi:hypothetical protein